MVTEEIVRKNLYGDQMGNRVRTGDLPLIKATNSIGLRRYVLVRAVIYTNSITYILKDLKGGPIDSGFCKQQLQTADQEIYRVDNVLPNKRDAGKIIV